MSVLNQSGEEQVECPLCMEPLEVDDLHFYPCTCGYQICRFCWNRIREGENGLCPACRKAYPENPADFTPLSQEQVAAIKTEKKAREQKRRNKTLESRRALANVRVVQNNLVFVVGLPVRLADPEILKRQEYFGKYGKIHKVVINQSTTYAGSQGPSASAYVTYVSPADALRAIQGVNNVTLDGRVLKGSLGTTKYCANFMKNQPCPKPECMYLHELGDPKASFTKEEMHAGLHQVYERKLHNQLLQAQRDKPDEKHNSSGNSSTNAEKSSSKDGNQSNYIPTTVVTSSHINVVNSSNGSSSAGSSNGVGSNGSGKEAWPSLGSSPPSDSPARKQSSPKPQQSTVKSQENGTSESSSPTQQVQLQAQTKQSKDTHTDSTSKRSKESNSTNGQSSKKSKTDKSKQKSSNSINNDNNNDTEILDTNQFSNTQTNHASVFDNDSQSYLSSELDELESERHSLLEKHSLLDSSSHSLLDDEQHSLLEQEHNPRRLLPGLHQIHKSPLLNGYGLLDRDPLTYLTNDRQISQINQGLMDQKEILLRERSQSEMLMRQNELLARQHNVMVEPKHYLQSSIGLESASEILGANFHQNPNMLPPFGMRVDNSMGGSSMSASSLAGNTMGSSMGNTMGNSMSNTMGSSMGNTMGNSMGSAMANSMGNTMGSSMGNAMGSSMGNAMGNAMGSSMGNTMGNSMGNTMGNSMVNTMGNSMGNTMGGFMMHNQQLLQQNQQQMQQSGLVNGFDAPQSANEVRYLAENMDKFFTDFHKAQQMRLQLQRGTDDRRLDHAHYPQNMLSAESLEMQHKQRMNNIRGNEGNGGRAAGDGDDDLDFDPFKETQKAFAELMETEMMQNTVSSGDNMDRVRRSRLAPPGFSHMNAFGLGQPRPQQTHHQSYNSNSAMFSDWTQMDPAIMSTSVNFGKSAGVSGAHGSGAALSAQQQELFARFNQLSVQPNGVKLHGGAAWGQKLGWGVGYAGIPLPPGFAPAKPPQHPAECIDAK
ncbi:hypothetical protein PYW07_011086 [Mythimna separata]|uniref:CCR4-NOT transcription complex subunit 4 n=1 Tax=Mythimna separata TaxID=271217 RepID=A0AAD7Y7N7_MYTSE|nr:hypothetical protein PYW07_011086 [Mythimna separata]